MRLVAHTWMSHVTHMNESCHSVRRATAEDTGSLSTHIYTHIIIYTHVEMSQVTHMNESCHQVRRATAEDTGTFSNGSIEFTSEFTSELDRWCVTNSTYDWGTNLHKKRMSHELYIRTSHELCIRMGHELHTWMSHELTYEYVMVSSEFTSTKNELRFHYEWVTNFTY